MTPFILSRKKEELKMIALRMKGKPNRISDIIVWPATKLAKIRTPIERGLISKLKISTGTIRGPNHKGVPAGKKRAIKRPR